jgi:NADH:ubiquinone oxidoreductase subunit 3 (subunit A)
MILFLIYISFVFFLVFLLKVLSYFISEYTSLNREELSSYECGFECNNLSRLPFSLRYFFLTLLFLLFDLEIVLALFVPFSLVSYAPSFIIFILLLYFFILFISLIYEFSDGALE